MQFEKLKSRNLKMAEVILEPRAQKCRNLRLFSENWFSMIENARY